MVEFGLCVGQDLEPIVKKLEIGNGILELRAIKTDTNDTI